MYITRGCDAKSLPQAQVELRIPKDHHKFILGKGGSKLKAIELSTATKIITPRSDENSEMIKITGTKEGIDKAKHEIQLISDEQVSLIVISKINIVENLV